MPEKSTREKLLDAATDLFAAKGYYAASVDEIAESIGIKVPNIYKYFKGKSALLESIVDTADKEYSEKMGFEQELLTIPANGAELKAVTLKQIEYTMGNSKLRKLRKIFTHEQFRDVFFSKLATKYQLENQEKIYTGIFTAMMQSGKMKKHEPSVLALQYISPITLMIQLTDRQPDLIPFAMEKIEKHIDSFIESFVTE